MTDSPRYYRHHFTLETLSPVRVGAGPESVLSPYTDFVQDGRDLIYLDPRKLERALEGQPRGIMDEFVRGVRTRMNNNRSEFELADFIRDRLGTTPAKLALRHVPIRGDVKHAQVRRHLSNGGQPYIPGSTLKGAFRTAILYGWLQDEPAGRDLVERLSAAVERLWQQYGRQLEEAEQLYREGRKQDGNRIAGPIPGRVGDALSEFSEKQLFGDLNDKTRPGDAHEGRGPEMRFLRLSDTAPVRADTLRVAQVARIKLANAQMVAPQWSEVLPRGVTTRFTLTIEPRFTRPGLTFLNAGSPEPLLERLDRFAADCLEWEADVLDNLSEVDALNDIYNTVVELEERERPERATRLRLGAGKTYFDNSFGLALWKRDARVFEHFRKLLGLGRNPVFRRFSRERFPATRSYVVDRGTPVEPLGWVQLSVEGGPPSPP